MIFTFPYHDPDGKFNEPLEARLDDLQAAFDEICISVTPATTEYNHEFLQYLEMSGCTLFHNQSGSLLGDHFRAALHLAAPRGQPIFYGFIDRVLFAMDTDWKQRFLEDLDQYEMRPFTIYDRSQSAWDTHPANYCEIEHMVSRACEWLFGEYLELGLCAFTVSARTADTIARQSTCPAIEVLGEWVLLAVANDIPITAKKVDWLLWEDPHWEGLDPSEFKQARERSRQETAKRINMMAPFMLMMAEDRFRNLKPWIERVP
jgi:hypothetical protein